MSFDCLSRISRSICRRLRLTSFPTEYSDQAIAHEFVCPGITNDESHPIIVWRSGISNQKSLPFPSNVFEIGYSGRLPLACFLRSHRAASDHERQKSQANKSDNFFHLHLLRLWRRYPSGTLPSSSQGKFSN